MEFHELIPAFDARLAFTRGNRRFLERLDPASTCHLVVDMQNGFMREGALLEVPDARKVVPAINAISRGLRAAGGTVAYTSTYTNAGNQGATGVALTETVPANTTFNAAATTPLPS